MKNRKREKRKETLLREMGKGFLRFSRGKRPKSGRNERRGEKRDIGAGKRPHTLGGKKRVEPATGGGGKGKVPLSQKEEGWPSTG